LWSTDSWTLWWLSRREVFSRTGRRAGADFSS
jgi:hypothetical protein